MSAYDKDSPQQPELKGSQGFDSGSIGGSLNIYDPENKLGLHGEARKHRFIAFKLSSHPNPHSIVKEIIGKMLNDESLTLENAVEQTKDKYLG